MQVPAIAHATSVAVARRRGFTPPTPLHACPALLNPLCGLQPTPSACALGLAPYSGPSASDAPAASRRAQFFFNPGRQPLSRRVLCFFRLLT